MTSFVIKIIAIISMLFDHSSDILIGQTSILNVLGRIAFPLFAFQLVIGYSHTSNFKKYFLRLLGFAIISQIPYSIMSNIVVGSYFYLNIFFTLAFGILAMYILDFKLEDIYLLFNKFNLSATKTTSSNNVNHSLNILLIISKLILISCILAIAQFFNFDYQAWGIILILTIYLFYKPSKDIKNNLSFAFIYSLVCITRFIPYFSTLPLNWLIAEIMFTILPVIFMILYNGNKGKSLKYFFYLFYPLHLIILEILHYFFI